jgi:hypothetical protein
MSIQCEKKIQRSKEAEDIITQILDNREVKLISVFTFDDSLIVATAPQVYRLTFNTIQPVVGRQIIRKVKEMLQLQSHTKVLFSGKKKTT